MWFIVRVTIATCITLAAFASSTPITFIFGDSLSEVGNNNFLQYSLAKSNYPWYGVDYQGGQATGRFTNGRTIVDIISARLGIPPPPPYLSLTQNDDALLSGVNYASGGAGILNSTGLYFVIYHASPGLALFYLFLRPNLIDFDLLVLKIERLSFEDQINSFNNTKDRIKAKIGEVDANKLFNKALYFIGVGSNDYVNNYLQPFLADAQQYTHDDFLELLTSTLDRQFSRLYQIGARKMVFNGLAPLGCIPSQRVKAKNGQCLKQVNLWVQQFNSRVQDLLISLNRRLPAAQIVFADAYPAVLDLINNPRTYGFRVSNTSCCNVDTSIGGLCLPNSKMCKNRRDYVFWDAFHPSDAANEILANKFFSCLFSAASPSPTPQPPRPKSHCSSEESLHIRKLKITI